LKAAVIAAAPVTAVTAEATDVTQDYDVEFESDEPADPIPAATEEPLQPVAEPEPEVITAAAVVAEPQLSAPEPQQELVVQSTVQAIVEPEVSSPMEAEAVPQSAAPNDSVEIVEPITVEAQSITVPAAVVEPIVPVEEPVTAPVVEQSPVAESSTAVVDVVPEPVAVPIEVIEPVPVTSAMAQPAADAEVASPTYDDESFEDNVSAEPAAASPMPISPVDEVASPVALSLPHSGSSPTVPLDEVQSPAYEPDTVVPSGLVEPAAVSAEEAVVAKIKKQTDYVTRFGSILGGFNIVVEVKQNSAEGVWNYCFYHQPSSAVLLHTVKQAEFETIASQIAASGAELTAQQRYVRQHQPCIDRCPCFCFLCYSVDVICDVVQCNTGDGISVEPGPVQSA